MVSGKESFFQIGSSGLTFPAESIGRSAAAAFERATVLAGWARTRTAGWQQVDSATVRSRPQVPMHSARQLQVQVVFGAEEVEGSIRCRLLRRWTIEAASSQMSLEVCLLIRRERKKKELSWG